MSLSFRIIPSAALLLIIPAALAWPTPAAGQAPKSDQTELESLREEVRSLREQVTELRARLTTERAVSAGTLMKAGSMFGTVALTVESPDGHPLKGFQARIVSQSPQGQSRQGPLTEAQGQVTSAAPLTWELPHGQYVLALMSPDGNWTAAKRLQVDPGGPLSITVTAPQPDRVAAVELEASLGWGWRPDLKFGKLLVANEQSMSPMASAGPADVGQASGSPSRGDAPSGDASGANASIGGAPSAGRLDPRANFPTVKNGIEQAGFLIEVSSTISVPQADGSQLEWRWTNAGAQRLLLTDSGVYLVTQLKPTAAPVPSGQGYFAVPQARGASGRLAAAIGYEVLTVVRVLEPGEDLPVAPGNVTVDVKQVLGLASAEVAAALGERQGSTGEPQVWLPAEFDEAQGTGAQGTATGRPASPTLFSRQLKLEAGQQGALALYSP